MIEYKVEFYRKCEVIVERNKVSNREREKVNFSLLYICSMALYFLFFFEISIRLKFSSLIESSENFNGLSTIFLSWCMKEILLV